MLSAVADKIVGIITTLIAALFKLVVDPFMDLKSIKDWVFGVQGDAKLIYGIFTTKEITQIYQPGYNLMLILSGFFIMIGVIMYGNRIASSGINAANRIYTIEFFRDALLVGLLLLNMTIFYDVIFQFNHFIVSIFGDAYNAKLVGLQKEMQPNDPALLGKIIIQFVILGLSLWASFYYMMRKLTLMIFMIMGPFMVSLLLLPWTRQITFAWFKEFLGTVFVQSVHAFTFWVIAKMAGAYGGVVGGMTGTGSKLVESVILYVIFIPVAEGLRGLLGLGGGLHNSWSKAGAMFGLSALAGMYGSVKGALSDKSVMSVLKGASEGISQSKKENEMEGEKTVGANLGATTGTTPAAERMLKAGDFVSRAGRAIGGVAGSLIGAPTGPSGSLTMATIGSEIGATSGKLAGRVGMAGLEGISNRAKTFGKSFKDGFEKGKNPNHRSDQLLADTIANSDLIEGMGPKTYEEFKNQMKERFPDIGERELNQQWGALQAQRLDAAKDLIGKVKDNKSLANADDLKNAAVDTMMNRFEKNNKAAFMEQFAKDHPLPENVTAEQQKAHALKANEAWQQVAAEQRKGYESIADEVTHSLSHGLPASFISKEAFGNQFAEKALDFDQKRFGAVMGTAANLSTPEGQQAMEVAFLQQNGGIRSYQNALEGALSKVPSGQIYDHRAFNRDYLAQAIAQHRTAEQKRQYIEAQERNNVDKGTALSQWNAVEGEIYKQNLQQVAQAMPSQEAFNAVRTHAMRSNAVISGISGVAAGTLQAVVETSGLGSVTRMAGETKLGQLVAVGAASAFTNASLAFAHTEGNVIQKASAAVKEGFEQAKADVTTVMQSPYTTPNAAQKQALIRNMAGYAGGLVGGIRGYQALSKWADQYNPYNHATNQQVLEASEIFQMAQKTTDDFGNTVVASDAVRLVTTADESYIEVKDQLGQTHVVSKFGKGDSSLGRNQVVYTDLQVSEQGMTFSRANPQAYMVDSGGGRQYINRVMNINPNQLIANRSPRPYQQPQNIPAYNHEVENGQFYLNNVLNEQLTNIRTVVERSRSYVIADTPQGETVRISTYGQGDARLADNQTVTMSYQIQNNRWVQQDVSMSVNGQKLQTHDYTSTFDMNTMIPIRPNKRLVRRKELEQTRSPQGVK
jgi:hypothetical protein